MSNSSRMRHQNKFQAQRRRFLKNALIGVTGLAGLSSSMVAGLSIAASQRRRHLVNIVAQGGWDSYWFHSAIHSQKLRSYANDPVYGPQIQLSENLNGTSQQSSEEAKKIKFTMRFDESSNGMYHPNYPGRHLMGTGMKNVFTSNELRDLLIWKGLGQEGQHGVGNAVIQQGSGSD